MNKIRIFSLGIPLHWIMIGASLVYGIALGYAVSAGKSKTWAFLLVPGGIYIFRQMTERFKFWLLAVSIPLSLAQIPRMPLPYGTQICEAILVFLALDEILFRTREHNVDKKPLTPLMICSVGLFSIAGLITNLRGNLFGWNVFCFLPFLIFFVISRKVHNREDAWLLIKISLLTLFSFLAIIQLAILTGNYVLYDPLGTEKYAKYFRMADGMIINLGPIRHITFATRIGAIPALGLPTCILLWMKNKGKVWWKAALFLIIPLFIYVIILSATRGSLIAAMAGSFLVILISGRFRSPIFIGAVALLLILLTLFGENIFNMLPSYNVQRLLTLSQGLQSIGNYHQRMDVLAFAWNLTLENPLGVGFGNLYHAYRMDDAIIYAGILQGTGMLGAIAFTMIVASLTFQFGWVVLKSPLGSTRDLASVGLSTLATGLLAGVSSASILFDPVHSYVFWTLLAVSYFATVCPIPSSAPERLSLLPVAQLTDHRAAYK